MINLRNAFWNTQEQRLRTGWRLLLQFILNIGLILLLGTTVSNLLTPIIPPDVLGNAFSYPVMFVATMIAVGLAGRFLDRRRFVDFGLSLTKREWWIDFAFGMVLAAVPVLILLLVSHAMGWIKIEGIFKSTLVGGAIGLPLISVVVSHLCVGAFQEIARIYQMRNLLESSWTRFGRWGAAFFAMGAAAIISVLMHLADLEYFPPIFLVYVLLDGLFLGLCYMVTGRAAIAIAMHSVVDFLLLTAFVPDVSAFFDGFVILNRIRFTSPGSTAFLTTNWDAVALIGILVYEMLNLLALYLWAKMRYGKFHVSGHLAVPTLLNGQVERPG